MRMSSLSDPEAANGTAMAKHVVASPSGRGGLFRRALWLGAIVSLAYVLGAAVEFFDLPPSSFLRRAFVGGAAWLEAAQLPAAPEHGAVPAAVGKMDVPDKTCDGFTLCMYGGNSRAVLVNMHGETVHEWHVPFSQLWFDPPHLYGRARDAAVYFNTGHVYPTGDLLAVIEGPMSITQLNASHGYGLVKLDKDSRVLWKYAERCHHDVAVDDDGNIYTIVHRTIDELPPAIDYIPTPCMVDVIDVLAPDGQRIRRLPLLEAIHDSVYSSLLCALERTKRSALDPPPGISPAREDMLRRDVLHVNAVKVLSRAMAAQFPMFRPGYLLISLRHLDAIIVLDPDTGRIVWAARGPWRSQHDPSFLDNGHLLLFDNFGSPQGSRVLEYDPQTQAFPWSYPGAQDAPFVSKVRGTCQRLANGNTLIVNSVGGKVFEVTPDHAEVWSCTFGGGEVYSARRYAPAEVPFVKGAPRAGR
jgi:hypothetical protein